MVGTEVAHGLDEGGAESFRAQFGADNKLGAFGAGLGVRLKHFRSSGVFQTVLSNVRNHSHDDAGILVAAVDQFSDWILAGPLHSGGGLIDDDSALCVGAIKSPIEVTAI